MRIPLWLRFCAGVFVWFGGDQVAPAGASSPADQAADAAKGEPFCGVIKAEITDTTGLLGQQIRYTIAPQRIRREARASGLLERAVGAVLDVKLVAGVICDLEKREVVLYHEYLEEKGFVRLSLDDYRQWISQRCYGNDFFPYGCSTHFCLLTEGVPSSAKRESAAVVVQGRTCDRLLVDTDRFCLDVAHCPEIRVERDLLRLVEAQIPDEVAGFPLLVRCVRKVPRTLLPSEGAPSRTQQLLRQGWTQAARVLEKVLEERVYRVVEISPDDVPSSAFSPPDGFAEDPDLAAFQSRLDKASSSGHHGHHWH